MSADLVARVSMLERMVASVMRRNGAPFGLGRSTLPAETAGNIHLVQAQMDTLSLRDGIPMMFHHGFSSHPPVGSDLHISFTDGLRSKPVITASNHQGTRPPTEAAGDATLYGHGFSVQISGGGIHIIGNVSISGNLTATGAIVAGQGGSDQVGLQTHRHPANNTPPTPGT